MEQPPSPSGVSGASSSEATSVYQGPIRNEASPSSVGASSGASSDVDQTSRAGDKSALDQRKEELIIENLKERKGGLKKGGPIEVGLAGSRFELECTPA